MTAVRLPSYDERLQFSRDWEVAMVAARLLSAADLAAMPDDERGELIDGVMTPVTPVKEDHWRTAGRVFGVIAAYLAGNDIGTVGPERGYLLRTNPDTVLAPDISFVSYERDVCDLDTPGFAALAPDLAVEVRSPANTGAELARRVGIYRSAGCPLVWVVDPVSRIVEVFAADAEPTVLRAGDRLKGGDVLPGFALDLASLFS